MCDLSFGSGSIFTACKDSIVGKAPYVRDLKDNVVVLERKLDDLITVKENMKSKIDKAEQEQMTVWLHEVQLWLIRVEPVEIQVDELLILGSQEIENLRLGGSCSKNLNRRYKYGKKVAKLLKVMTDLLGEVLTFSGVEERIPQDLVYLRPSIPIDGLESKLEEVWSYIREAQVKIIGLYGKGGVGKTTLLTQINNKFFELSNNFLVIWVTVSKDLRLGKIQETILIRIGLDDEEYFSKPFEERAMDICRILSRKKFVLLLDDIWEWVDLISIGIPPPSQKTDFKVVFTTRSLKVCTLMNTHINVEVQCLKHNEAWRLFQKKVGEETLNGHPDIPALAKKVAEQCGGLPDVLNIVGQAMATKRTPEEWEHALTILRNSAHEFPGMGDNVYPLLKFSYDHLTSETRRSCFLYCSLFPKGFHIAKRDLVDCWISEGFLKKYDGILARNFGYNIIRFLLHACLLEEGENDNFVRMHDVIRDMALWIAYEIEKGEKFSVHTDVGLIEAPRVPSNVQRLSLMKNKLQ